MALKSKIAIITPYYRESIEILRQCHESVLKQQGDFVAKHFMIADGYRREELDTWQCNHSILHQSHNDNGNTPRAIGCLLAESENYDYIAFLDADNWYHNNHLRSLLQLQRQSHCPVIASYRTYHLPDGTQIQITEKDEEDGSHIDTSCVLLHKSAFSLNKIWSCMPKQISPICDRIFRAAISHNNLNFVSTKKRSVAFRTQYRVHYEMAGLEPPSNSKTAETTMISLRFMMSPEGVSECVNKLGFWPMTYLKV